MPAVRKLELSGANTTMMRRWKLVMLVLGVTVLSSAAAAPWLIYWFGLSKIEGRPTPATQTMTAEQTGSLFRKLRISQPVQIDPLSPYSYFFQGITPRASARIAWVIAGSHNAKHLGDHRYWHLSGAALTVWLTRNWTPTDLIATAIQQEKPAVPSAGPQ